MPTARTDTMETLLVGIDAASRRVLDPLVEAGSVPTLAAIVDEGVYAPLESQIPPWTASAWPSIYTGMNPGKHGVFGFLRFEGYDWDVVNATDVRAWTLWELLDHHDLTSVVVNAPVTDPPRPFSGALVPGYVAPDDPTCHPPGVLDDVRDHVGDYRVYASHDGTPSRDERVAEYERLTRMRGEAFRYLADRFDPAFGFVQFQQTDTVFHELPDDEDAVRRVYEAVDEEVGAILDAVDPTNVVVVSDHGMGPYDEYEFRVNEHLRREGYTRTVRGGAGMPSWDTIRDARLLGGDGDDGPGGLQRFVSALARVGVTSQRIQSVLEPLGLDEFVVRHAPKGLVRAGTEQVDFAASTAYMRSRIELGVRLNLEGREPNGTVAPEEYDAVRQELIDVLSDVRTPAGDPVFEAVAPREEYFTGPEAERAVDVVTVPDDFEQFLSTQVRGGTFGDPTEPWNHKLHGIVAARGEAVATDATLADAHLFDVAPTVLATLGVPVDDRMDGTVLPFAAAVGEQAYPPFEGREQVATDDRSVEERLENLGYIE